MEDLLRATRAAYRAAVARHAPQERVRSTDGWRVLLLLLLGLVLRSTLLGFL